MEIYPTSTQQESQMYIRQNSPNYWKVISIFLFLLIVVTVSVGLYLYYNPNSPLSFPFYNTSVKNNNISNSNENDTAVTPINTPLSRKQVSADNLILYEIRITKKTEVKTNENILEIFKRILGLPEISRSNLKFGEFDTKSPIVSIFIDERKDTLENIFINDALSGTAFQPYYYILLENHKLDSNKVYEDENFVLEVSIKDDELIKYVKDIDYCKVDSDCYLAYRGCSYGSYNFYQELSFFPFGCGPITDSEFSNEYLIGNLDENLGCVTDVKYSENKCVDNVCRAFGRDLSCQK